MFLPSERIRNVRKSAIRRLYDAAPQGSINLGLGEPDFRTPEFVRSEAARVLREEPLGYTSNAGLLALREKVAAYHSNGLSQPFTAGSVCITNGSEEALFAVMMSAAGPGDEVLLPDPGFTAYRTIAEITGARVTTYDLPAREAFALDRESFKTAVTEKTRIALIVSPSNPTGAVLSAEDLSFISEILQDTGVYVIADEIYREFFYEEQPASLTRFYDRTIIVSGLSKMMSMTGWRLGWAVGPADVIQHVTVMHQYISTCASAISQKAGLVAFSEEGVAATAEMRDELKKRRDVLASRITSLNAPFTIGAGAYYAMLDISGLGTSEEVAWSLLEDGVITVPGSAFGTQSESFLRLSFCIAPQLIEEGISRIEKAFSRLRRA